jgi:histidinol-phosphate aminotransferase
MPTYVLYRTLGEMQDAACVEVPYDPEYNLPVERLIEEQGAVTFVASPNSPSGTIAPWEQLEALAAELRGLLVIDEAYTDFADENALDLVRRHQNVIILRTLSKGYSLAGLRLGFGVMQPAAAEGIIKVKDSYPVDAVATAIGAAAMEDQAYKQLCVAKVKLSRGRLIEALRKQGFQVWPSQSNFLLAQAPLPVGQASRLSSEQMLQEDRQAGRLSYRNAADVYEALKARGILVRYFNQPRLDDKLRITVGTDEQNAALIAALGEIVGRAT